MLNIILPCHIVCNYNQYRTILNQLDLTFERYRSLYQWELVTVSLIKGFPHHTLKLIWESNHMAVLYILLIGFPYRNLIVMFCTTFSLQNNFAAG
ncbi:hypothetical protein OUZ56_014966 [Daphnia magna]|uniref:Uncharacterized protein n=1 Tax=Daphnia magna TaxID=35525 RepID=A0ABR0ALR4_9CRUS|nr:hypothetical protein OUZ56_014966 [Daphnia magna]